VSRLAASLEAGSFVRLMLSRPAAPEDGLEKILARRIDLPEGPQLSLTYRYPRRDLTKNLPLATAPQWVGQQLHGRFHNALLGTTRRDWQLYVPSTGAARLVSHPPANTEVPAPAHDQSRHSVLDDSARDWLHGLDLTDPAGKVRASMADKHRQVQRYLELFTHWARECGWHEPAAGLPPDFTLVDMGCGKGYLTFGLWHLFHRLWHKPARVIGLEARPELVTAAKALARRLSATDLEFVAGNIDAVQLPRLDVLVALHACNTATDDALRRGIERGAQMIVVAPCCHHEVRPQLGRPDPLAPILRHGIMAERLAEWLTDGLRALYLEWAGYRTRIFEFVASEHTPKNLMIAATQCGEPYVLPEVRESILRLKKFFGVRHHTLDPLLELLPARRL
jgi:SAM-dependent methyltransferase